MPAVLLAAHGSLNYTAPTSWKTSLPLRQAARHDGRELLACANTSRALLRSAGGAFPSSDDYDELALLS